MEREPIRQAQGKPTELTGQSINPTLESGGNNMTDVPGASTEGPPRPGPNSAEQIADQIRQRMQQQGMPIDADSEHVIRGMAQLAQAGIVSLPGAERQGRAERTRSRSSESEQSVIPVLSQPDVLSQLASHTPDFSGNTDGLKAFRRFVEELEPSDSDGKIALFADFVTNPDREAERAERGIVVSPEARRLIFEWTLEQIIGLPEKGSHEAAYRDAISDIYISSNITKLRAMSSNNFDQDFATYIGDLIEFRSTAHELRRSLTQGDAYKEFIQKQLKAHGLDFILNDIAGVSEVVSLWETFTSLKAAQTKTWFNEGDYRDIQTQIKSVVEKLVEKGQLTRNGRPLTGWEIYRALAIGATFFRGTQRFAMYSSVGRIPPGTAERIGSHKDEYIVRTMDPFKMTAVRFFNEGGPRELLKAIRNRLKDPRAEALLSNENALFGIEDEAWLYNGLGALDILSHGWRAHLMFFGDTKVDIEGRKETLLQFFTRKAIEHGSHFDPALGWEHPGNKAEDIRIKKQFAESVEDAILGQRLYLSTLIKHGFWEAMGSDSDETKKMKTQLWQKVAMFDPMGLASLSPQVLNALSPSEKVVWDKLTRAEGREGSKLGIASVVRLNQETAGYFDEQGQRIARSADLLRTETKDLKDAIDGRNNAYRYQIIDRFFSDDRYGNGLSPEEAAVIRKVIDAGVNTGAEYLTSVKLPFAFLVNDAPHVAWDKTGEGEAGLGDENLFRILLSDQGNLIAAYNEMNVMVENPTQGAIEHLAKAVESIGQVNGRGDGQKKIEPFILAYLDMAAERPGAWAFGGMVDFFNKFPVTNKVMPWIGNSEFEKYWRSSGLSFDEEDRAAFLESLARLEAISTDVSKGVTTSQLAKLKKETKSWALWTNWKWLKIFTFIFGAEVAIQLIKTLVPKELWESAGVK